MTDWKPIGYLLMTDSFNQPHIRHQSGINSNQTPIGHVTDWWPIGAWLDNVNLILIWWNSKTQFKYNLTCSTILFSKNTRLQIPTLTLIYEFLTKLSTGYQSGIWLIGDRLVSGDYISKKKCIIAHSFGISESQTDWSIIF